MTATTLVELRLTYADITRFWSNVDLTDADGCWTWRLHPGQDGYGKFGHGRPQRTSRAHRVAYLLTVGSIPAGLHLDHLCRNRMCVRPDHLEPVTCRVNLARGATLNAANSAKTQCNAGHPLAGDNLRVDDGYKRICRACGRERQRQYRARIRADRQVTR